AAVALRCAAADSPLARRSPQVDDYFGEKVADPYRWMEDIDSPETAAWVGAERAATSSVLETMPERSAIRSRLKALWNYPKFGLPLKRGGRVFYTKNDGLQNQALLYVIDTPGAPPRVLIDPNALAGDGTIALTTISPSEDGKLLGYGLAVGGSDWTEFHVRDVATGTDLPDTVRWVKFSDLSWTHDGAGFFYGRYPDLPKGNKLFGTLSGRQLFYHRLGSAQADDRLVFELKDHPEWFFNANVTDDGRYLAISLEQNGATQTALFYMDLSSAGAPRLDGPPVHLLDHFDATYAFVGNIGTTFYVFTTRDAPRGRVVSIDIGSPASPWRVVVPQTEDSIEIAGLIGGKLVVSGLHDVKSRLALYGTDGAALGDVALPGIGAVSEIGGRSVDPDLFYAFSSFLTPAAVMSRNMDTGVETVFQSPRTPFDPSPYETRQEFCTSRDGTRVPMFITAKKGLKRDGSAAAWLYGYGGFNISFPPAFGVPAAVWLEMGGIFVQANLRGGGEYGEAWHLAGTKERKQNVFDDFIAAADFLVAQGYTRRDRLAIDGRSNGGLLIAAVLNQRPDLCAVAVPTVGVMDMLRYHKFTIGAAWAGDYGTSDDPAGFRYLRAYSPVHNVKAGVRYPPVLISTGDHDDRVFPAHSFKYAATMQYEAAKVPGSGPILIRIDSNAGHGGSTGSSPVSKVIDEWADKLGFSAHFMPPGTLAPPPAP
ncbi:MAG TPA: prolyl oligopeptidase family serine peptidase, partial [Opitutaceae bacterium]